MQLLDWRGATALALKLAIIQPVLHAPMLAHQNHVKNIHSAIEKTLTPSQKINIYDWLQKLKGRRSS